MDQERVQQRKIKALQQCKITCCAMAPVPNKPPAKTVYHTKLRTLPIQGCHVWLPISLEHLKQLLYQFYCLYISDGFECTCRYTQLV